jgi:hypothetical protein
MELSIITETLCHPVRDIEKEVINGEYDGRRKEAGEVFLMHFPAVYLE